MSEAENRPRVRGHAIDGKGTKVAEQAVWVSRNLDRSFSIQVHVVDVLAYAGEDVERTSEDYLTKANSHKVRRSLSLLPGIPRKTLTVLLDVSTEGEVTSVEIASTELVLDSQRFTEDKDWQHQSDWVHYRSLLAVLDPSWSRSAKPFAGRLSGVLMNLTNRVLTFVLKGRELSTRNGKELGSGTYASFTAPTRVFNDFCNHFALRDVLREGFFSSDTVSRLIGLAESEIVVRVEPTLSKVMPGETAEFARMLTSLSTGAISSEQSELLLQKMPVSELGNRSLARIIFCPHEGWSEARELAIALTRNPTIVLSVGADEFTRSRAEPVWSKSGRRGYGSSFVVLDMGDVRLRSNVHQGRVSQVEVDNSAARDLLEKIVRFYNKRVS